MNITLKANKDLFTELSNYGLNPADWDLIQKSQTLFFIQNKAEPSFYFRGLVAKIKGRVQWTEINLASL